MLHGQIRATSHGLIPDYRKSSPNDLSPGFGMFVDKQDYNRNTSVYDGMYCGRIRRKGLLG